MAVLLGIVRQAAKIPMWTTKSINPGLVGVAE